MHQSTVVGEVCSLLHRTARQGTCILPARMMCSSISLGTAPTHSNQTSIFLQVRQKQLLFWLTVFLA
eukprot:17340_5